jgi:uncharacterized delta-60 repeat protein
MRFTLRFHAFFVYAAALCATILSACATHAQTSSAIPGTVDPSFGSATPIKVRILAEEAPYAVRAVAVTGGKVVMAASCYPPNQPLANRWCFSRHDANGSFDDTFDGPSGAGNGRFAVRITSADDQVIAMAIQTDGKMVIVGKCDADPCVARFNANGSFDAAFGDEGGWTYLRRGGPNPFVVSPSAADVAIQSDGKIVVGGTCERPPVPGGNQACVWRLNPNGTFDTSFDAGVASQSFGRISVPFGDDKGELRRIAIQPNGKVLMLATCQPVNPADLSTDEREAKFCFTRLNTDGIVDSTFSVDGRQRFSFSSKGALPRALALQADGKIVAGGECSDGTDSLDGFNRPNGRYFPCLVRLNADGTIDSTFESPFNIAQSGRFLLQLDPVSRFNLPAVRSILVQSDEKLVIVFGGGNSRVQANCDSLGFGLRCTAARLNGDGSFDLLFDGLREANGPAGNGIAYVGDVNVFTTPVAALRPNGRIVIAGNCDLNGEPRMCVQQFNGGDGVQPACTLNVDGSGGVRLATDGLIMMRAMRGVITASIVNDAGVLATAPRSDWTDIRDYLVESCGATPERGPRLARAATACSLDIDGDNNVSAATDGVLLLRALLGFTGTALTDNVPIIAAATRKTPALISGFLATQCGLSL